ncbi:hypothetical protein KC332_g8291 [Hortaea werneckii]|uniref:HRDC domain-containing protein n=1 Tax=Hortaea werneckii TaxID=91943 RepID=A0A3M7IAG2_HORWE|nr:hypothetical protein KC329_g5711 [Hortaea werneckii]KAI7047123.1 hypothetical protein KC366_g2671 [Hortaea werneckii]KAI7071167.1 hypothetical protein KC327_g7701 [Hortaea werneckii]KAI7135633.1 hypothetical protein KC337_g2847 [Hortaea werneckii]KAI7264584.1 hypothetical protein KC335_g9261 [Hortaea werneckii]
MAAPSDFASLQSSIQSALVQTTRTSSQLAAEDLSFHRSLSSNLGSNLDRQNARLLSIADRLLGSATTDPAATSVRSSSTAPRLSDIEAVEGNWRAVVDVVDSLLERADTALDEFTGAVKRLSPGAEAKAGEKEASLKGLKGTGRISASLRVREIEKPQLSFDHVPQNDETGKFAPLLVEKPHAMVPFKGSVESGKHPYQAEIEQYTYPASMYTFAEPTMYHPFESTTAVMVDTEEAVETMLEELKQAKEIAIDLEHHDHRSYIGIVSLMQISTRDKDWIVDTLKPWRRKLQCLNHVFADPSIIKILHGAFMDVMWLQRDLGLYLVGLFDTHYACRALGYPGGSYAYLLKRFCNVDAQKQYQLADWRIRPLPQELFDYARSDTHYLLYIFDHLRNELITKSNFSKPNHEGDKIYDVLTRSSETALQVYEHPVYDTELGQGPGGWYKLLARTPALLSKEQFAIFRAVHKWRDDVAREQDDSVHYVMPNHQIFSVAKAMPTTRAELLGVAQPGTQTVRLRADELVSVIVRAKEDGKNGPDMVEVMSKIEPQFPRKPAQRQEQNHSVAAFLPQRQQSGAASGGPVVAANPRALRSDQSSFWGPAFSPSSQKPGAEQRRAMATANIDLSVPLPPLTAEVFADPAEALATPVKSSEPATPAASTPADTPKAEDQDDDVFVLKQLGGGKKRKRQQPSAFDQEQEKALDGLAQGNDEVALPSAEEEANQQRTKSERKRAKKEAKKAKKTADGGVGPNGTSDGLDNNNDDDDDVPFDYTSAPSMLNPPRESKEDRKKREKKQVDPYKKAMDAPKGLGRNQRERAGRTMTYR